MYCFVMILAAVPAYLIDSSVGKESACNAGDPGSIPRSGSSPGEGTGYPLQYSWASLLAQTVKNPPVMQEAWLWSLGWEDPLEVGRGNLLHYPCLENPHGQRSLRGYSPFSHEESDMTEWLSLAAIREWRKGGKETRLGEILFPRLSPKSRGDTDKRHRQVAEDGGMGWWRDSAALSP